MRSEGTPTRIRRPATRSRTAGVDTGKPVAIPEAEAELRQ